MTGKTSYTLLLLPFIALSSLAQSQKSSYITKSGSQKIIYGSAENFTGLVQVEPLFQADKDINVSAAYITFEPGARSAWHTHPVGQKLIVTSGVGLTQQKGQPVQIIRPGDVVLCPPGVEHWHGASPDSAMTHLAVTGVVNGKSVEWMDKVTDKQYQYCSSVISSRQIETNISEKLTSNTLSLRQQAIPLIASYMASSQMKKLNTALNKGLDAGLTINETKEILVQLYAYTGFPRSLNALNELMKVVEARKQRGVNDIQGKEPANPVPIGDELRRIGIANQTKIAGKPVQGSLFEFAPIINQFLQTHLFGDIFARDNLDWQSRELATVGALAATPGVETQLLSHIRGSLHVGLTKQNLYQIVIILREYGENNAASRVEYALQQVINYQFQHE